MTGIQINIDFDGKTYTKEHDQGRLKRQLNLVFDLMKDANWRTLSEISARTNCPEASISARLRDLRKAKFGQHSVKRQRRGHWSEGVFEYQLLTSYNGLY